MKSPFKLRLLTFGMLCWHAFYGQLEVTWQAPITVAASSFGSTKPRVVLNAEGMPVVVFGKNNGELYLSRMVSNAFGSPIQLASSGQAYVTNWTSADISAKGDTIMLAYKTYPLEIGAMYLVRSFDGGASIFDTQEIAHQQPGVAWLPSIKLDEAGHPHVIYMGHDQNWTNPQYYILHSTNWGASFLPSQPVTAAIPQEACDCCPAELVLAANKQVLLYRNNDQNLRDIYGVYSNDSGSNFLSACNTEQLDWLVTSCPSTAPDGVIINDTLWSVSASKASGAYRIYLSNASLDSQITRLATDSLVGPAQPSGNQNHPRMAASSEFIGITWHENTGTNYDVYVSLASTSFAEQLYNSKVLVSDNQTGNQLYSDLVLRGNEIHLVYQDNGSGTVVYRKGTIALTNNLVEPVSGRVSCWPNPVKDICQVQSTSPIQSIALYNEAGQRMASYTYPANQSTAQLHLAMLRAAKYTLKVQTTAGNFTLELLKL